MLLLHFKSPGKITEQLKYNLEVVFQFELIQRLTEGKEQIFPLRVSIVFKLSRLYSGRLIDLVSFCLTELSSAIYIYVRCSQKTRNFERYTRSFPRVCNSFDEDMSGKKQRISKMRDSSTAIATIMTTINSYHHDCDKFTLLFRYRYDTLCHQRVYKSASQYITSQASANNA